MYFQSFRSPKVKESARRGIECAYEAIFSKDYKAHTQKTPISVTVKDFARQVDGSSAGLAYSVAFAAVLKKGEIIETSFDIPDIIAATGEVDIIGNVRRINSLKEKIQGAISSNVKLLFYPHENSEELKTLLEQDKAFRTAVKNSSIMLKDVASVRQLFCEMGILPDNSLQDSGNNTSVHYTYYSGPVKPDPGDIPKNEIFFSKSPNIFKALMIILTAIILCIPIYRAHVLSAAPTSVNLAFKKIAYASSDENIENSSVNAVDGNIATRWSSEYSDRQWIYVDLGRIQTVSSVILYWEAAYAKQYQIQVSSDGFTWAVVYTKSNNEGGENVVNFNTVEARYIKMYAWQRATQYGYSLREFEVYGSKQPQPQIQPKKKTPKPNAAATTKSNAESLEPTDPIKVNRPFPQRLTYTGCIKPDNVSQEQMENTIKKLYEYWKAKYVKSSNGNTTGGGYYVEIKGNSDGNDKTVSSVHGYGMIIFALMAGYDKYAKEYFDGMYNMYDKHRSTINSNNMSWTIGETEEASKNSDSSTDGDLDIAYALLLAHGQWGSDGKINYYSEAKRIITEGIKRSEISHSTMKPLLGDWAEDQNETRVTDLMTDHFHAFWTATGDSFWKDVIDNAYNLIPQITDKFAPDTGLLPDFVVKNPARPAGTNTVEGPMDNGYGWNSCYYPLRLATDFAHYGSSNSKAACTKMLKWLKSTTNDNPANIKTCYSLDGVSKDNTASIKFTAPFIAACIVDNTNQSYLNDGWTKISNWREKCDGDSINLLSMLLISGNWWIPV
ncbi:MAG TPA: glycosyl hydrolase family 8 [Ruminiclostridium sp.]|nr:glycosyl hydrolase family 8 [Ruminiclostridium sp.]